jgi:geranylgeranylglycerol-phosphate geranylgeranyltransferase
MSHSSVNGAETKQFRLASSFESSKNWLPIMYWNENPKNPHSGSTYKLQFSKHDISELFGSQLLLFNSRKRWGFLFAAATLSGIFCVPSALDQIQGNVFGSFDNRGSLLIGIFIPISTLLIITGMYVLNDLFDADLDRINGKTNRPIPSGKVSKTQALLFVVLMNVIGLSLPVFTGNLLGTVLASIISLIGILYSLPKISLKDKFVLKTCAIGMAMASSLLLGASIFLYNDLGTDFGNALPWINIQSVDLVLYPTFAAAMLAMMVFVTSPLNDLGDVTGDKEAGRRTIPIVLGKEHTVLISLLITIGIALSSWVLFLFAHSYSFDERNGIELHKVFISIPILSPVTITATCILIFFHLLNVLKRIDDQNYIRESVTKKSIPLHLILQLSLVIGCLLQ